MRTYLLLSLATSGAVADVIGQQHKHGIGDRVRFLELLASIIDAEEMHNRIEFVG